MRGLNSHLSPGWRSFNEIIVLKDSSFRSTFCLCSWAKFEHPEVYSKSFGYCLLLWSAASCTSLVLCRQAGVKKQIYGGAGCLDVFLRIEIAVREMWRIVCPPVGVLRRDFVPQESHFRSSRNLGAGLAIYIPLWGPSLRHVACFQLAAGCWWDAAVSSLRFSFFWGKLFSWLGLHDPRMKKTRNAFVWAFHSLFSENARTNMYSTAPLEKLCSGMWCLHSLRLCMELSAALLPQPFGEAWCGVLHESQILQRAASELRSKAGLTHLMNLQSAIAHRISWNTQTVRENPTLSPESSAKSSQGLETIFIQWLAGNLGGLGICAHEHEKQEGSGESLPLVSTRLSWRVGLIYSYYRYQYLIYSYYSYIL